MAGEPKHTALQGRIVPNISIILSLIIANYTTVL